MSDLPTGWIKTKLGEVSEINMGQSPSGTATNSNGQGIPLVGGASDFEEDILTPTRYTSAPTKICQPNDLILCIRATIGKLALAKGSYCLGRGVAGIRSDSTKINSHWLCYALIKDAVELDKAGTGSTFRSISKETIFSWIIPLPPLDEQRRIVAKLDTLFSHTRKAREELDRIPDLIKRYKQAVLSAACSGKLTEDWRRENDCEKWNKLKLENVANIIDPHPSHRTPKECKEGVPYLGIGDINSDGKFDFVNARQVSIDILKEHQERYTLTEGDLIFRKIGTLGKVTRLPLDCKYTLSANVILIQPISNIVEHSYLFYFLQAPETMKIVLDQSNSTSQAAFGIKKLRAFEFMIAALPEQQEIVKRLEEKFKAIEQMEAQYQKASKLLDRLEQATLSKAFRGELVPQDPNDEPAS
ncbi:MAG: restriction endonuclease subunit S, partial [Cyanobacteriota bacterium ELA615]